MHQTYFCKKGVIFCKKKYKNKGFGCFGSNCFLKMSKSGYFYTKYLDFKNYLYGIRHYYVIYTKVIKKQFLDIEI